jgi:hypothetical protein
LDWFYPTTLLIEIADGGSPNDLKTFFLKVAEAQRKPGEISPDRLGRWLKRISGRIVDSHRLERDRDNVAGVAVFRLVRV